MTKISECRVVLLVGCIVFCVVPGCVGPEQVSDSRKLISYQPLLSPQLLESANLKVLWETMLPMKRGESLQNLYILGSRIYALSDRNYIVSLSREKGSVIFSGPLAEPGLPVLGLGLYDKQLFSMAGGRLVEINPDSGAERSSTQLGFRPTIPVACNSSYFYLGATDRRIHVLRSQDKVQLFEVAAENDSAITSILAGQDFVAFATDEGNLIKITPDKPVKLWQFDAAGGITAPIAGDENALFIASKDTNVYRINLLTGKPDWKYQAQARLEQGPKVTKGTVYQYVRDKGLSAIDKESGQAVWQLEGGADLLAESAGKAYVITKSSELVVMDNKKAKRLYSADFAAVEKYAANVVDSKIYIADASGRIACLKPIE